jgi:antitoxin ParD1/3/4
MSNVEKLSVSVTVDQAEEMRAAVSDGEYASTSEIVREALRAWIEARDTRAANAAYVRRLVDDGFASGAPRDRPSLDEFLKTARARAKGRAA